MPLGAGFDRAGAPAGQTNAEIDVRDLLLMLWRRKMVVVGCVLIGLSHSMWYGYKNERI
jgi:uncharacterized protein involved in exopolysaccharide biosynthesis